MKHSAKKSSAPDVLPTPERQSKPDYETITLAKKTIRRKVNTLQALYDSGDIDAEAVRAANRWYVDYVFAVHGYADFLREHLPLNYIKGDRHTFGLSRAHAAKRLSLIREYLGSGAHLRLELMLVSELSFSAIGAELYPHLNSPQARLKIAAQCALILEQLSHFYDTQRRLKFQQTKEPAQPSYS